MKCDCCGRATPINYGSKVAVLCGACMASEKGKNLLRDKSAEVADDFRPIATDAKEDLSPSPKSVILEQTDSQARRYDQGVVVTDIRMPFSSMVIFMVKWVIASIPALLILFLLFFIAHVLFGGLLALVVPQL